MNDDGQGIDVDKVLKKAIKLGLADSAVDYSEEEIAKFIMHPGFSTQTEVNKISGRGVGMNVVESTLREIGGKVEIINNYGKGCSFVLRIPMNLALINGTIVRIGQEKYIIPTLYIKEFFVPEGKDWITMQGKEKAVKIRQNILPLITEEAIFGIANDDTIQKDYVIIFEVDKKKIALPVDEVIGRKDIVSKPLSREMATANGIISGASILGDGQVSLIIDVESLFNVIAK